MDHAAPEGADAGQRRFHVSNGEVRQGGRVAGAGATLVNAQSGTHAAGLPAAPLDLRALGEFATEQARPEPTCAVRVISWELDKTERSAHVSDHSGLRVDWAEPATAVPVGTTFAAQAVLAEPSGWRRSSAGN